MLGEEGAKQIREDLAVSKAADFVTENAKEEAKAKKSKKAAKEDEAEE
jgi:trigger factor